MLHTDIPTESEFRALDATRGGVCVSIYLPTTPLTRAAKRDRIVFKNLTAEALGQLNAAKADKRKVAAIAAALAELHDDDLFWAYLADGLAVFATPEEVKTFRLPIVPLEAAEVSDRFHVKPLLPLLSFPSACFVLALSQGATRFVEVTSSLAEAVKVEGLPKRLSDAVKRRMPRDRAPTRRIQGSEGMKVLMAQYCRAVDRTLRPILAGRTVPLILAAAEPLAAVYRSQNTYAHLLRPTIPGNPERLTERELADRARAIAVKDARRTIRKRLDTLRESAGSGLAVADLVEIARAAVQGRVGTLLVDIAASRPGTIDPETGAISPDDAPGADTYDLLDELVGLTVRSGGQVIPVSSAVLPGRSPVAAILRYRL